MLFLERFCLLMLCLFVCWFSLWDFFFLYVMISEYVCVLVFACVHVSYAFFLFCLFWVVFLLFLSVCFLGKDRKVWRWKGERLEEDEGKP